MNGRNKDVEIAKAVVMAWRQRLGYGGGGQCRTRGSLGALLARSAIQAAAARGGSTDWCLSVTSQRETDNRASTSACVSYITTSVYFITECYFVSVFPILMFALGVYAGVMHLIECSCDTRLTVT